MPRNRSTFNKRQKEQQRQQKQREKAARKLQRKSEKSEQTIDEMEELRRNAEAQSATFDVDQVNGIDSDGGPNYSSGAEESQSDDQH
jgi:hypothetical protein